MINKKLAVIPMDIFNELGSEDFDFLSTQVLRGIRRTLLMNIKSDEDGKLDARGQRFKDAIDEVDRLNRNLSQSNIPSEVSIIIQSQEDLVPLHTSIAAQEEICEACQ